MNTPSRCTALEEAKQSGIVPLLPSCRWRGDDDPSHSVLEDQPSARGARQRSRREVIGGPCPREALLSNGPAMPALVTNLARRRERLDVLVGIGSWDDELVPGHDA
jgi:hypothetical protein